NPGIFEQLSVCPISRAGMETRTDRLAFAFIGVYSRFISDQPPFPFRLCGRKVDVWAEFLGEIRRLQTFPLPGSVFLNAINRRDWLLSSSALAASLGLQSAASAAQSGSRMNPAWEQSIRSGLDFLA